MSQVFSVRKSSQLVELTSGRRLAKAGVSPRARLQLRSWPAVEASPVLAILLILGGSNCFGQTEIPFGSRIPVPKSAEIRKEMRGSDEDNARVVTYDFGRCVVSKYPRQIAELVGMQEDSPELKKALGNIFGPDCFSGSGTIRMPYSLVLGAIFRALYVRDFARLQPVLREEPYDFGPAEPTEGNVRFDKLLNIFGDCVVRADLSSARALTLASPGDAAERAAFAAIMPKLGPCMPNGLTVKFSRSSIAAIITHDLYMESLAARTTVAAGGSH